MITATQQNLMNKSYVKSQLEKVDITERQSIKITDSNGAQTHFIGLNDKETISMFINYLLKRKEVIK